MGQDLIQGYRLVVPIHAAHIVDLIAASHGIELFNDVHFKICLVRHMGVGMQVDCLIAMSNVHGNILEEYYAWLKTVHPEKGSKLEEAVRYSLNQKQPLMAFLDNGEVPISNNLAENAIRPFALGRKNWLFCDTTKGAETSAIVYSMVESAKANGVEPFAYLQHVLLQLPYLGKTHSHEEPESLMPWAPYIQQEFGMKNSDAYVNPHLD